MTETSHRYNQAKRITYIGAIVNALLGIGKILGGLIFKSHGLIADGVHSLSDLLTDGLVLIASKYGSQEADDSHPYGHQRIETAATMVLAVLLVITGIGIGWDAVRVIIKGTAQTPELSSLPIAVISVVANEILFHATYRTGKAINSPLLITNAWHHRTDAASSFIVLLGILGSVFGLPFLDPLTAVIVGGMIIKMGTNYGIESIKELVDTATDRETIHEISSTLKQIDGILKIHQLRNRMMGENLLIDVHILVEPHISVSEGHHIALRASKKLRAEFPEIHDITIHVDPEDDEVTYTSPELPSRAELEQDFLTALQAKFPQISHWQIHYLDNNITLDIFYTKSLEDPAQISQYIQQNVSKISKISIINFFQVQGSVPLSTEFIKTEPTDLKK